MTTMIQRIAYSNALLEVYSTRYPHILNFTMCGVCSMASGAYLQPLFLVPAAASIIWGASHDTFRDLAHKLNTQEISVAQAERARRKNWYMRAKCSDKEFVRLFHKHEAKLLVHNE